MNKLKMSISLFVLLIGLIITSFAQANTYTFSPIPADLYELDHYYYYEWGIQWNLPKGEIITEAEIRYYNIYNWQRETNDRLYTNLLNTVNDINGSTLTPNYNLVNETDYSYRTYTNSGMDNQNNGNFFSGINAYNIVPSTGYWTDTDDSVSITSLLSYSIPSNYFSWISDGNFGFGIDPDCHYINTKIEFEIITNSVPEPATIFFLGFSLIGLAGFARRKFKK